MAGSAVEVAFAAQLAAVRPELGAAYTAALPGARSAVLSRVWRALHVEPLPFVAERSAGRVTLKDGRRVSGPVDTPLYCASPPDDLVLGLDGQPQHHPADLLAAFSWPGSACLVGELANSVATLALARAGAAACQRGAESLADHEQSVVDGHSLHPCCRNRTGFSVADHLAYGPEHRPVVALDLVAVPAEQCLLTGTWPDRLRDHGDILLPLHPWQTERVLPAYGIAPRVRAAIPTRPLMSLRTMAPVAGGPHVKTAVSTRMTESVRDISGKSLRVGRHISALLSNLVGRLGGKLDIQRNLAGAAVLVNGVPSADLAAVLRAAPVVASGEIVLPVGALTARPPLGGPPVLCALADDPVTWLAAFVELALPPLLTLMSWGVALYPHDQNLLLVLRDGCPHRLIYRDLADIRVSPRRLAGLGIACSLLPEQILSDDPVTLRRMLYGSAFSYTLMGLVSTLAQGDSRLERQLWALVARQIRAVYDTLPTDTDTSADRRALLFDPWPTKPHTLLRLDTPPNGTWASVPNPLN
ncbi:MAG: IucA/IucC family protein [Pseudonocardiaceae bacterium]